MGVKLSRGKIAYDLSVSPYTSEVKYNDNVIVYHFSSELYRDKFNTQRIEHKKNIVNSLTNRFGIKVVLSTLSDLKLYAQIEKRGYYLKVDDEVVTCPGSITLSGDRLIIESLQKQ